ncbi:MAG TPA: PAS domain S-box protein [Pyrinomonadaceae bacterium]|nr:PAS domain S-box protein [Pyrinomonadaceae bacterium]
MTRDQRGASFRRDELFRLLVEKVEDFAVFAIDLDGTAASWNPGVGKLLGYDEADFIGLDSCVLFTPEDLERGECEREMRTAAAHGRAEDRRWHLRRDGTRFWANGLLIALPDDAGNLRGYAKILRDETAHKQMEDRLRESDAFGRNILESISDAFYTLDREWRFTYLNRRCEPLLGRKREELLGKNLWEELPEAAGSVFQEQLQRASADGEAVTFETFSSRLEMWVEIRAYPSPAGLSVYLHDISKRKRAEATLRESQTRLALSLQAGRAGTFEWNILTDANVWSPELEALYGVAAGTFEGNFEAWSKRVVPEDAKAVEAGVRQAMAERREVYDYEFRAVLPDNSVRWLAGRARFEYDPRSGQPVRMIGINVDIDDRKRAEAERDRLLDSERAARAEAERERDFVQLVLDHAPLAVGVLEGAEHRFALVNPDTERLTGLKREQFIGRPHAEVVPEADEVVAPILKRVYETGASETHEIAALMPNGEESHLRVTWTPLPGADSRPRAVLYLSLDITGRKQAETRLRDSEERYRTLFASIDEGFCVIEMLFDDAGQVADYRFLEFNPAFEKLTGIPSDAAMSAKTVRELIPNLEAHWFEIYGRVAVTGEPIRFVNGSEAMQSWFDVYAFRVGMPEERKVAILFNNITERRRTEHALGESQERLRIAMDAAQIYSWEMNLTTRQVEWSGNLERVIGFSLPADFNSVVDLIHPEDREPTVRKILAAVEGGYVYESEFRLVNPTNGEVVWVRGQGLLAHGAADGQPRFAGITQNITGRKRAEDERERLLSEAQEANRLKDEFLATLSHELRTPLTAILGWSRLLQASDFDEAARTRALRTIERNAQAQTQLIDDLLDTSRIITGKLRLDVRPVDLASVVTAAAETARPAAAARDIRLQTLLDPQAGPISGDPDRLQQVVWNLLSNAIKFTPKGGRVQVRLERVDSHVEVTVADTGRGIAAEFLPHVFDRFRQADQTTTRTHGGLGLGLAIVRQLVELHGGSVQVESAGEGRGTSFTVSLPLLSLRRESSAADEWRTHPPAREAEELECPPELAGLSVLVVDDEPDTRELLAAVLTSCGAQVSLAATAAEAFEQIERNRPDVLITDIGMPDEDGYSLLSRIRQLPPERGGTIPAAALTAYARAEDRVRALRSGFQMHVPKPVEPAELITVVANLAGRIGRSQ